MQHALKGFLHDTLNAFSSLFPSPSSVFLRLFFGHSVAISGITLAAVVVVVTAAATVNFWALLLHFCHFVAALVSRQARFTFPSLSLALSLIRVTLHLPLCVRVCALPCNVAYLYPIVHLSLVYVTHTSCLPIFYIFICMQHALCSHASLQFPLSLCVCVCLSFLQSEWSTTNVKYFS